MKKNVAVKRLVGTKWHGVPAEHLKGTSISKYIKQSKDTVIAGIYVDDKPVAFLSNSDEYVEKMKTKGFSFHIDEWQDMFETEVVPGFVLETFPGSEVMEVKIDEENEQQLPLV